MGEYSGKSKKKKRRYSEDSTSSSSPSSSSSISSSETDDESSSKRHKSSRKHRRRRSSERGSSRREKQKRREKRKKKKREKDRKRGSSNRRSKPRVSDSDSEEEKEYGLNDGGSDPVDVVKFILEEFPAVADDLEQLLRMIDDGQALFLSLSLNEKGNLVFLLPSGVPPTLEVVGSVISKSKSQGPSINDNHEPPNNLHTEQPNEECKLDDGGSNPTYTQDDMPAPKKRVIGPAMPFAELLAAAAKLTEAEAELREAEIGEDDEQLFIEPPPPAAVNEAASANDAERLEEVTRIIGAEIDSPYDVVGINRNMAADSIKKRMAKQIAWDKTRKHNQPTTLVPAAKDFEDVMDWLERSKISFAVQANPVIYNIHIEEFWRTAKVKTVDKVKMITATVRNKEVIVTEDRIRTVLSLGDNHKDPMRLSKEDILEGFRGMKYVGDFQVKNEIKRNRLTQDWRFIFHVFAMSMGHRKGLIFYCMVDNANRMTWAMYPRFVQLLINDQHPQLPHDGNVYKFQLPTGRQITELKTNEWVMLHHWMYREERLPLVKAAYKKYRDGVTEAREKLDEEEDEAEEEPQLVRKCKDKGKQADQEGESKKKKKDTPNPERVMADSICAGSTREHIERLQAIHVVQEPEKRERRLKRREMTEFETPVVVTTEEEQLDAFVEDILVDPHETTPSKSPSKKRKTWEGSSKDSPVKQTPITQPPPRQAPRRSRPFQDLYDRLSKDTGAGPTKEICILKHQVNDTNVLREKLKQQRKKNKELHAFVTEQTRFIRFQQDGMTKMYEMIKELYSKAEMEPRFSSEDLFRFDKFKEEEEKRKAENAERKERRLESTVNVNEDDESEEEEVDKDEMPARFVEWGLEDEVMYETDGGEEVAPQHPEWFKKEREKLSDFYQMVTVEKTEATDKIISWKYCDMKGMFIVKRRGGVIQHFKTGLHMQSLPRWDIREIGRLDMINPTHSNIGADFERLILRECVRGFTIFKPRRPRRRVSKTTKDPITGKGKVTWVIDPAKVVTKVKIPPEHPVMLTNFKKWFYDGKTGEAVIRSTSNEDIRILDPMDVFMFCLSDLNILYGHTIHVGAGNEYKEEGMLFQRAVERARERKIEMIEILNRTEKMKERDEAKKKKNKDKKQRKSPAQQKGPVIQT
ncbi:hypothetical protein HanLR1_Chr10g0363021 [Helianthus annuus]|nr:hypothetical protein HanHA89_Chr10g0385501 [Helianthus annuus]KAJ0696935.1 hypothetical protein HanLR1_Chr10g0363021 [Helianthus annuus]